MQPNKLPGQKFFALFHKERLEGNPLKNDVVLFGGWINRISRYRRSFAGRMLEPYGVTGCQFPYLLALNRRGGMSQEEISDMLKTDKTSTAKAVKKLEEDGFVVRRTDASDKRTNRVFLTQKGLDTVPHILDTMKKWDEAVLADISEEEYDLLERLLRRMADSARDLLNA